MSNNYGTAFEPLWHSWNCSADVQGFKSTPFGGGRLLSDPGKKAGIWNAVRAEGDESLGKSGGKASPIIRPPKGTGAKTQPFGSKPHRVCKDMGIPFYSHCR